MFTRESISKELARIQASVPKMFKDMLFEEKLKTPDMKLVFEKGLEQITSEEKRKQIQITLDKGVLNRKQIVENPKVAQQRDIWVQKEIKKSVKAGRLPTRKQLQELMEKENASK